MRLIPVESKPAPCLGGFLRGEAIVTADLKADFRDAIEEIFEGS